MGKIEKRMNRMMGKQKKLTPYGFFVVTVVLLLVVFSLGRGIGYLLHKENQEKDVVTNEIEESFQEEKLILDENGNPYCIVVDAGHGGRDPGKVGSNNILEKDLNLSIATKLSEKLSEKGIHTIMTRDSDEALCNETDKNQKMTDLNNRIQLIKEKTPNFVISIHQNSFTDHQVKGAQVFYLQGDEKGKRLASVIQNTLNTEIVFDNPREIKGNGSYYLLKKSPITTVIVECGFLSCEEECIKLTDEDYQNQIVDAILNGILAFIEDGKKE